MRCQRIVGILAGTMSRDAAYSMLRLGRNIERADMTTRVLDVRAGSLIGGVGAFDDIQWLGVLQSLSALQMYRRATRAPLDSDSVVRFCLQSREFPRSVAHCLREVAASAWPLCPSGRRSLRRALTATEQLAAWPWTDVSGQPPASRSWTPCSTPSATSMPRLPRGTFGVAERVP